MDDAITKGSPMDTTTPARAPADLAVVALLAGLLGRLENSTTPVSAVQYREVVSRLSRALADADAHPQLRAVLDAHPAAAELYENLHYDHAGLCRSPLDAALSAEMRAVRVIDAARRGRHAPDAR